MQVILKFFGFVVHRHITPGRFLPTNKFNFIMLSQMITEFFKKAD